MPERVLVLSTGGTIASTAGENGASPTKAGEQLVEAVPELDDRELLCRIAERPDNETFNRCLDRSAGESE